MTLLFKQFALLPACVAVLICWEIGFAQQSDIDTADKVEQFALSLVSAGSDQERSSLLAAKKELLSTELRKELVKHGNLALTGGQYSAALSIYNLVEDIAIQIGDKEGVATASLNLGTVSYFQGNYDRAGKLYTKAERLFSEAGNRTEAAKALFGVGLANKEAGNTNAALAALEKALKEFQLLKNNEESANTLTAVGSIYYSRGDYLAASRASSDGAALRNDFESLLHTADAFYMQRDYGQAINYYEQSLNRFHGNPAVTLSALGSSANAYYYEGNYDRAIENYQKALALEERLGDHAGIATQLQGLGNAYRARGDFGSALESYFRSLTIAQKAGAGLSIASTLGSIGLIRAMQGDKLQVIEYYKKSLTQFEAIADKVGRARMLSYMGNVYYAQGEYQFNQLLITRNEAIDAAARELYDILLKPAEEQLRGKTSVMIVPDGPLWRLTFESLKPDAETYLIERHSVAYSPSFSVLREIRKLQQTSNRPKGTTLLALENPRLTGPLIQRLELTYGEKSLAASSGVVESQTSTNISPRSFKLLDGLYAEKQRFTTEMREAQNIFLAVPVVLDESNPLCSVMVLSPGRATDVVDGLFYLRELMNLDTNARVVVISNARIARQQVIRGNSTITLQWAWFVAGTPTIVFTRWQQDSSSLRQFISDFYLKRRAMRGSRITLAQALRQRMLALRSSADYRHSYFWSGLALLGDSR